jgi:hypothetical protein
MPTRVGDNAGKFLVQAGLVAATEDELGDKIRRSACGLTKRHTEAEKIFGVHGCKLFHQLRQLIKRDNILRCDC